MRGADVWASGARGGGGVGLETVAAETRKGNRQREGGQP